MNAARDHQHMGYKNPELKNPTQWVLGFIGFIVVFWMSTATCSCCQTNLNRKTLRNNDTIIFTLYSCTGSP